MNNLRNSVRLIGHIGTDPEVKALNNGKKVARLSLATNSSYKDDKGKIVSETCWHTLVAWGRNAEIAEKYVHKGSELAIEGKLTSHSYTDKEGIKRYVTEIVVNELLMLGGKS